MMDQGKATAKAHIKVNQAGRTAAYGGLYRNYGKFYPERDLKTSIFDAVVVVHPRTANGRLIAERGSLSSLRRFLANHFNAGIVEIANQGVLVAIGCGSLVHFRIFGRLVGLFRRFLGLSRSHCRRRLRRQLNS